MSRPSCDVTEPRPLGSGPALLPYGRGSVILILGILMSYQVLARKWRPRNFQQMVGQEHVLRMLTNALLNQRLHHAYLFTGTRGVGKTTLARIFAKSLNCESGISAEACNQCNTCQSIDSGRFLDLIEVDAASRTRVEDTREILENVQYAPTQGRFKIYLIDEVHMLSGHSFNALLKTLEEPPGHVKFLLATTDPKRLPITILSRCLQFNLKRVPVEQIHQHLQHICKSEGLQFEEPALKLLAKAADGSLRDALSLLDQSIAYCGEIITTANTQQMLGSIEQDVIYKLLEALTDRDGKKLLTLIQELSEYAPDFNRVLEDLLNLLHQINIAQVLKDSSASNATIQNFATRLSPEEVQLFYQIALIGRRDLFLACDPAQGFEMVLLRMLAFEPFKADLSTQNFLPEKKVQTSPAKAEVKEESNWSTLLPQLGLSGLGFTLASHCKLISIENGQVLLNLTNKHEALLNKKLTERIEQAFTAYFKKPIKLTIQITNDEIDTPAKQREEQLAKRQAHATDAITQDDHVQKVIGMFNATIDMNSIKAIDS